MAPSSSSPSTSKSPPPPPRQSPHFTPIQEEQEDCFSDDMRQSQSSGTPSLQGLTPKHQPPTPLPPTVKKAKSNSPKRLEDGSVSCNKCRPNSREKISIVPLENTAINKQYFSSITSPNGIFKSIFSSLIRKSPKSAESPSITREEQWKITVSELTHKLIQATRKRDEALSEVSRLKYSMGELETKLNKLEIYCHALKSVLDEWNSNISPHMTFNTHHNFYQMNHQNNLIEHFLVSVSESRSSVRLLSRSLSIQMRHMGGAKVFDKVSVLQPYDIKVSVLRNPRSLLFYLEALLNRALFQGFESVGFQKNASNHVLNPMDRCESNFTSYNLLRGLTWEEVLEKGTRYFSEEFSKFCDRKMSEIVGMLGWNKAWTEPLLQAFFGASKNVWLVHLLANSVHPGLPIFRVDKGVSFDSAYMEDMGGDKVARVGYLAPPIPNVVRIMVSPGFYVYGSVVKCKVLLRYSSNHGKGLTQPTFGLTL